MLHVILLFLQILKLLQHNLLNFFVFFVDKLASHWNIACYIILIGNSWNWYTTAKWLTDVNKTVSLWSKIQYAVSCINYMWWGIITRPPIAKWQNFVTVLLFGIKILTTKYEVMLHAVSLNLPTLLTAFTVFAYINSLGWTGSVRHWCGSQAYHI